MPEFKGGNEALYSYMSKNIKFNYDSIEIYRTKFFTSFVIDTCGNVRNADIENRQFTDIYSTNEKTILEVINKMPAWIPAKHKGRKVPVRINWPISIHLSN